MKATVISVLTVLAGFQLAAALPSTSKGASDLAARAQLGSKLCVSTNLSAGCETISNASGMMPGQCIALDSQLFDNVSSIAPLAGSWCTYFKAQGCQDTTSNGCGKFDANSPINDLTTVSPTNPSTKCEGNMDKKIRSFLCNYV
ncbi:hypothetical protein QBC32DRAFT_316796 [Pseudoneurospora amorphoporcata]|uniref:Uncharacterized protein n=1 Tax=Pseudoneurospora amorphoporcata TaxID=241081 RepID=A0AAN6NP64_9PEZI|nr:hypothetical protein QBC32DRAFT_316796 [Pseudoneurospora amorphoporcata]